MTAPHVITLITQKSRHLLTEHMVNDVTEALSSIGIPVQQHDWLAESSACDLFIPAEDSEAIRGCLSHYTAGRPIDWVVQPLAGRKKKLLISDMDSTMITVECIDELADFVGKKEHVSAITERAMNGELDFKSALIERVQLLAGLPETTLDEAYANRVKMTPGAKELVGTMRSSGALCVLVSGGFTFFTNRVRRALGFDIDESNQLEVVDGKLTGKVKDAKLASLKRHAADRGLALSDTLAVGDGANDLPMIQAAGLGVAYHAKPAVQEQANVRINHNKLTALLYAQGYRKEEILPA